MSAWRGKELPPAEPLAGALAELSNIVGASGKGWSPNPFTACLHQLQALHDEQVAALTAEAALLRKEMDILRREAQAVDFGAAPRKEAALRAVAVTPLVVGHGSHSTPAYEVTDATEQDTTMDTSKEAWHTSTPKPSSRDPSKDTVKSLSPQVSKNIAHQLEHFRSEGDMVRRTSTGSALLDDYMAYRKLSSGGDDSGCMKKLVASPKFDVCMGTIIVMNAVTIGFEASMNRAGREIPLAVHISVEIAMRLVALRRRALCNPWVQFDMLLVGCGFFDLATTFSFGPRVHFLDNVMLVRTFRLARLARVLRLMVKFRTLWMLVQGLLNSLLTLTWTCIIICILLFVFAVLGLEVLQPDPSASKAYNDVASEYFGSLLRATTSLLQGLTLDSFGVIYRPVMHEKPLTVFYFVPFMLVVSIALMNLVTALMVNLSLEQAANDTRAEEQAHQKEKAEVVRILKAAFYELDTDHSGCIDLSDMLGAPEELRALICQVADTGDGEPDLASIFRTLDYDNSGHVKIDDFCQGLLVFHNREALQSYFFLQSLPNVMSALRVRRGSRSSQNSLADVSPRSACQ